MSDTPETTTAEWRGNISAKVNEYGRRLDNHDRDIRELRVGANATTVELARLGSAVERLTTSIESALETQAEQRQDEFKELQLAVASNRMTTKEKVAQVMIPLLVAMITAIVIILSARP